MIRYDGSVIKNTMSWSAAVAMGLAISGAIGATVLIGVIALRSVPEVPVHVPRPKARATESPRVEAGVVLRLTSGDDVVERTLPAVQFALAPGESLDRRIAPGPFEARFEITVPTGAGGPTYVGAHLRGGSLIVRHGGDVVLRDAAGDEPRRIASAQPVIIDRGRDTLVYEFRATGDGASALRAEWRPERSVVPLPLPEAGSPLVADAAVRGEQLVREHGCLACHAPDPGTRAARIAVAAGPALGQVGARVRPAWLREWLADPHAVEPGTAMPNQRLAPDEIDDLTHFLVSLGGPLADPAPSADASEQVDDGRALYHAVGCVACHGPRAALESLPGGHVATSEPSRAYRRLDHVAAKTAAAPLAAALRRPEAIWTSGHMPDLALTDAEATAIAHYLTATAPPRAAEAWTLDPARIPRGEQLFGARGCAACHELGPDRTAVASTLAARPWSSLEPDAAGCLSDAPPAGMPVFGLAGYERDAIRAYLEADRTRRAHAVPWDDLVSDLLHFDCLACHAFHGGGGPEPAVASYFTSEEDADMGDEGRIPPPLTDAGARLTTSWMRSVLTGGDRARPYVSARMPQYGAANVDHLPAGFASVGGATSLLDDAPEFTRTAAVAGRTLVGAKRFNCLQCHSIAGAASTGTPGPNLALMPGRLTYDSFARWLHDPALIRPGTRMPSYFLGGISAFTDYADGRAADQIGAMWSYLSQGESLPLPDGVLDPSGLELVVVEAPIVFRTYMRDAGTRAIACGFPEQIHYAFDAEQGQVTAAWTGRFLSASGAWGARGGSETNPDGPDWTRGATGPRTVAAPGGGAEVADIAFGGYELDAGGAPVFLYTLRGADIAVRVRETTRPDGDGLRRTLAFTGPAGARVEWPLAAGEVPVGTGASTQPPSAVRLPLGPEGAARLELTITWENEP